jgi:mRNA interferase RelE/StbE
MTYRIQLTPKALKQIGKLDKSVVRRIRLFLQRIDRENRRLIGKALVGDAKLWRYRVGNYRILVSIEDGELLVLVVDVEHRREVYRSP